MPHEVARLPQFAWLGIAVGAAVAAARMRSMCAPCGCGRARKAPGWCWILSGSAQHSLLVLKNPDRVVLDVAGARLGRGVRVAPGRRRARSSRCAWRSVPRANCAWCSICRGPFRPRAFSRARTIATATAWSSIFGAGSERWTRRSRPSMRPRECARLDHRHRCRSRRRGSRRHRQERHAREGRGAGHRPRACSARSMPSPA